MSHVNDFQESSSLGGDVGMEDVGVVDVAAAAAAAAAAADAVSGQTAGAQTAATIGGDGSQGGMSMSAVDAQTPRKRGRKRKSDSQAGGDTATTTAPTMTNPAGTTAGTSTTTTTTTTATTPSSSSSLYASVPSADADISWYEIRVVSPDELPCHSDAEFMEGIQEPVVMREAVDGNIPRGWGKRGRPRKNALPPTLPQNALATLVPDRGRQPEMRRMIIHAIKRRWATLADWRRIPKNISEAVNHVQDFINAHRIEVELGDDEQQAPHDENASLMGEERKRIYYYLDQTLVARAFKAKWKRSTTNDQRDSHSKCRIGALLLRLENRDDVLRLLSTGQAKAKQTHQQTEDAEDIMTASETEDEDARCGELWELLHAQYMDDENTLVPIPDMLQKLDSPTAEEFEPNGEMGIELTPLRNGEAMAKVFWTRMVPPYRAAIDLFVQREIQQQHKMPPQTEADEGEDGEEGAAATATATTTPTPASSSPPAAWKIQGYAIGTPWIHWLYLLDVQLSGDDAADSESASFLYARTTDLIPQSAEELRRRSGYRYFQERPSLPQTNPHESASNSSRWTPSRGVPPPGTGMSTTPTMTRTANADGSIEQARVRSVVTGGTARPSWLSGGEGSAASVVGGGGGGGGGGDAQQDAFYRHVIAAFREGVLAGRQALSSTSLSGGGGSSSSSSSSPFSAAAAGGGGRRHLVDVASDIYRIRTFIKETTLLPDAAFVRGPQERADDLKRYSLTLRALHDEHDRLYLQRVHAGSVAGGAGPRQRQGRLPTSLGATAAASSLPIPAGGLTTTAEGGSNNDSGGGGGGGTAPI